MIAGVRRRWIGPFQIGTARDHVAQGVLVVYHGPRHTRSFSIALGRREAVDRDS